MAEENKALRTEIAELRRANVISGGMGYLAA
jgi:hypothetical protein